MFFSYFSDHTYLRYSVVALNVAKSKPCLRGSLTSLPLPLGFQNVDKGLEIAFLGHKFLRSGINFFTK